MGQVRAGLHFLIDSGANVAGKPWASIAEQVEILVSRGLKDARDFEHYLSQVGYYRLSGYSYPMRQFTPGLESRISHRRLDVFLPDAKMSHVVALYEFDESLRQAVWQGLSRLEIALRFDIGHTLGRHDPYLHLHVTQLWTTGPKAERARKFETKLNQTQRRSSEEFVKHHHQMYSGEMPMWVITEILEFGLLVNLYSLAPYEQRKRIASIYQCRSDELESWLRTLNYMRNLCAHHARLWNRKIVIKPAIKYRTHDQYLQPSLLSPGKPFATLAILIYLLQRKGFTDQAKAIAATLARFPALIPGCSIHDTGAPPQWQTLPLWADPDA